MGHHLSIDKYTSPLEDLLAISPATFKRVNIDKVVSPRITQHLKIWRFYKNEHDQIKSKPVPLHNLEQTGFVFSSAEAYLVLLVYRANTKEKVDVVSFPHSLWGLVESADNLTPRGLANTLTSDSDASSVQSLDSFLLSKRENKEYNINREYKYMLFVWNGKEANALLKASALSRGFELDSLLNKAGDSLLSFIFNGGVIRGTKFQKGRVLVFDHASSEKENDENTENPNEPDTERVIKTFETVYLFQWLIPDTYLQNLKNKDDPSKFTMSEHIVEDGNDLIDLKLDESGRYLKRFKWVESASPSARVPNLSLPNSSSDCREKLEPQPILKLAYPNNTENSPGEKPTQKPAIPLLHIGAHNFGKPEGNSSKLEVSPQESKVPSIKGIELDMNKVARKHDFDYYDSSSSDRDRIFDSSMRSNDSPNPMAPMGMGLDLSKAKAIQNELLNKNKQPNQPVFNLALPGSNQNENKVPSLVGLPMRSTSNSNGGGSFDQKLEFEQSTGPQLQINIKNIAKLKDDLEMNKEEEDIYEPPKHKRGSAQPDEIIDETMNYNTDETEPDYMMKNTSVAEIRNNKFKQICSEIIPSFLYLGSDYLAKDKDILLEHKI